MDISPISADHLGTAPSREVAILLALGAAARFRFHGPDLVCQVSGQDAWWETVAGEG